MAWEDNKNTIIGKVQAGTASAAEQAWYDTWVQAGSPQTQAELQAWKAQNTGVEPNEPVTYWNPDKQLYQTDPWDEAANYKPGDEYGYYLNSQGQYVYGLMPEETHQYYDGDGYTTVEGPDPRPSNPPPSTPGMADDGGQFFGDPNDPDNTGNLTDQPGYQPPIDYDPFNPPPTGGGTTPPPDGGGTTPPPGGGDGGGGSWLADNPLIGWEGLDNTDFYQQQFKDLRDRGDNERLREYAAALKAQAAQNAEPAAPTDPWAWANDGMGLAEVQLGTGAPSQVQTGEYQLNPNYGLSTDMTGRDIYSALLPTLSDQERVFANKHLDYFDQLDLSKGHQGVQDWVSNNPYTKDKGWVATLGDIGNSIYNPIYESTGPQAPVGYASPINL